MQKIFSALACMAALLLSCNTFALNTSHEIKGFYLLSDYPAVTVQADTTSTIELRLHNYASAPTRLALQVQDVPPGWSATLLGGGQPIAAAMVGPDENVPLQLRLKIPAQANTPTQVLTLIAKAENHQITLPLQVTLAKELPAKLTLDTPLPAIKGGVRSSFDYSFTVKNDSGKDLSISVDAKTPQYFDPTFTEGYGSQQISTLPIKAGHSKDIKLNVRPPSNAKPGTYPIDVTVVAEGVHAATTLQLQIVGQPQLRLSGRDGLMSSYAEAGKTTSLPILVSNEGGADADDIALSATAPSGWRIEFDPKTIPHLAPGQQLEVQAQLTPSARSLAGDYMASMSADSGGQNAAGDFRITVSTSSQWGIIGVLIVAVAVLILVGAVARFGRR
jgi:uncharacterized membrane protein